jgi:hypothetical protein
MNYKRLYEYRFRGVPQERREAVWRVLAPAIHEMLGRPERVLDPAAGRFEFISAVPAQERWAVDAVAHEGVVADPGLTVVIADIMAAELPRDHFDGVFVSNFLEHLGTQEAVAAFLERMFACIEPGGRIAIMGPNFRHLLREYFDFADHSVILTEKAVVEHLYAAGFDVLSVRARFIPYSFTGRLPSHPALIRTYLRVPPLWRIVGKQFLVLGQRPA